jgi:hypothetical protein
VITAAQSTEAADDTFCSGDPSPSQCTAEVAREQNWERCRASAAAVGAAGAGAGGGAGCELTPGCEWCPNTGACVPRFPGAAAAAGSNVTSFCDWGSVLASERPRALSTAHVACSAIGDGNGAKAHHIVRTAQPVQPSPDSVATVLALNQVLEDQGQSVAWLRANHTYMEGLRCAWTIECRFNATVELRFGAAAVASLCAAVWTGIPHMRRMFWSKYSGAQRPASVQPPCTCALPTPSRSTTGGAPK